MAAACPQCHGEMQVAHYASKYGGQIELDFCFACRHIWFDQHESVTLAPAAIVDLFEVLHEHANDTLTPHATAAPGCVRCKKPMRHVHDQVKATRFVYHRCEDHGRLIGFWQFLREKQFVRDLTAAQRGTLAATIKQFRCQSCGGGVDVARDSACSYCGTPLAVLDPDAVKAALAHYRRPAAATSTPVPPPRHHGKPAAQETSSLHGAVDLTELVVDGLGLILRLLD
ncbi:zf-TFIIB domain-containing protein [Chitinimonas sp. BJYL2]|uniref:zf-TFIIB domain-containing protein n=1 Tax=Chitinimonas sp. BJYL2 TaxID=2976696 RepID=UPI0022B40F93|nr:zf-TFIIB domain-containing protein [Chitinimonas sp. BJYL2]